MRKAVRKIAALVLVLLLCGTALAAAETVGGPLEGQWEDLVSERAWMRIERGPDGGYAVRVYWGSGIYEGDEWQMTGTFDPGTASLAYSDGSHCTYTYDDGGNVVDVLTHYEGAAGVIRLDGENHLRFDSGDDSLSECRFVRTGD